MVSGFSRTGCAHSCAFRWSSRMEDESINYKNDATFNTEMDKVDSCNC